LSVRKQEEKLQGRRISAEFHVAEIVYKSTIQLHISAPITTAFTMVNITEKIKEYVINPSVNGQNAEPEKDRG
jgi:hypothetical protein